METEEKMMTGEESIKIITEMLNKTRVNIRQGSFHLLFWGWMIVICSLGEYILTKYTGFTKPWLIWLLVIPGMFVSMIYGMVNGRKAKIHTDADKIWMWTWFSYLFATFVLFTIQSGRYGNNFCLYPSAHRNPYIYLRHDNKVQASSYWRYLFLGIRPRRSLCRSGYRSSGCAVSHDRWLSHSWLYP